jgi:hypothetical protein
VASDWTTVFRRSTVHPAVFAVRDRGIAERAMQWADRVGLAHEHRAYLLAAELNGWALLDGGLSHLQSHARGRLRTGLRIVGWSALRLVAAELDVVAPRRLLVGETSRQSTSHLRHLAGDGWLACGPGSRQAGMLASYVDARGLHDIARTLVGVDGVPGPLGRPRLRLGPGVIMHDRADHAWRGTSSA